MKRKRLWPLLLVFCLLPLLFAAYDKTNFSIDGIWLYDDVTITFGNGSDATLQYDEDGEDAMQWNNVAMFGAMRKIEHLLAADTLTAAESGKVFYVAKAGAGAAADIVVTLPPAAAGLEYIIIDANETAAADITITAGAGDKIMDGSAAASYIHDTDVENYALCYLVAMDATDWVVVSSTGTWTNE
jgi:hypothetical protein